MQKNAGFTLIELLVVVLIIGILSAVALPQYQKAVMKARAMSLLPMLRSINDAEQIYYLANGTYTISFDDLDISLPAGATVTREYDRETFTYNNWECLLRNGGSSSAGAYSAYCNSTMEGMPQMEKYFKLNYFVCWGGPAGSASYSVCSSISNDGTPKATRPDGTNSFHFN